MNLYNWTKGRAAWRRAVLLVLFLLFCAGAFPFCLCAQSPSAVTNPAPGTPEATSAPQIQAPPVSPQQPQSQPLIPPNAPAPAGTQPQPAAVMPSPPAAQPQPATIAQPFGAQPSGVPTQPAPAPGTQPQPQQAQGGAAQPEPGLPQTAPQAQQLPGGEAVVRPPVGRRAPVGQFGGSQPAARGQFSFNFDDADVFSVIQTIFGDVLKVNYVVDPKVKGRVTFRSVAPVPRPRWGTAGILKILT